MKQLILIYTSDELGLVLNRKTERTNFEASSFFFVKVSFTENIVIDLKRQLFFTKRGSNI